MKTHLRATSIVGPASAALFTGYLCSLGCGGAPDSVEADQEVFALQQDDGHVKVVQANIENGGSLTDGDTSRGITNDTAHRFARLLKGVDADVIGMQELGDDTPRRILEETTGQPWRMQLTHNELNGHPESGVAVLWREDKIAFVQDLGHVDIATVDGHYTIRFTGALLRKLGTDRSFAVFSGKIAWEGSSIDGHPVDDTDRSLQAVRLQTWITKVMANHPRSSRIVTMDMNSGVGTEVWKTMSREYFDGNATDFTHDSHYNLYFGQRLDHIWWDLDNGPRATFGFVDGPRRSEHFGSDHRFVWATVFVKK